jgi:hypothetical protein
MQNMLCINSGYNHSHTSSVHCSAVKRQQSIFWHYGMPTYQHPSLDLFATSPGGLFVFTYVLNFALHVSEANARSLTLGHLQKAGRI